MKCLTFMYPFLMLQLVCSPHTKPRSTKNGFNSNYVRKCYLGLTLNRKFFDKFNLVYKSLPVEQCYNSL